MAPHVVINQYDLALTVANNDRTFEDQGGYQSAQIEIYRRSLATKTHLKLAEQARALLPELKTTLEAAAGSGRTSCEFVVGKYGLHGTLDREGKSQLATVAGMLISEVSSTCPDMIIKRNCFGQRRDDYKVYRIFLDWSQVSTDPAESE